jgi:hypothetical protein
MFCHLSLSDHISVSHQILDDGDIRHAPALAHGLQAELGLALLQRVHQRGHEFAARGAQGVAQGDGAAVHVHLGGVHAGVLQPGQGDAAIDRLVQYQSGRRARQRARQLDNKTTENKTREQKKKKHV